MIFFQVTKGVHIALYNPSNASKLSCQPGGKRFKIKDLLSRAQRFLTSRLTLQKGENIKLLQINLQLEFYIIKTSRNKAFRSQKTQVLL